MHNRYSPQLEANILLASGVGDFVNARKLADLKEMYNGPGRYYHTWEHMLDVLSYAMQLDLGTAGALAALFHDAVYDPKAKAPENETGSLELMQGSVHGISYDMLNQAEKYIAATAEHTTATWDTHPRFVGMFLDCDIVSIANPNWEQTVHINGCIRQEYMTVFPEADVDKGRKEFLRGWLKKPAIFLSAEFAHHEWQARRNIHRLISHDF